MNQGTENYCIYIHTHTYIYINIYIYIHLYKSHLTDVHAVAGADECAEEARAGRACPQQLHPG